MPWDWKNPRSRNSSRYIVTADLFFRGAVTVHTLPGQVLKKALLQNLEKGKQQSFFVSADFLYKEVFSNSLKSVQDPAGNNQKQSEHGHFVTLFLHDEKAV